ncbi:MAG: hypothetical protein C5B49_04030 [Bdellovibrio sp.]|nr:MAG: hypothetical protein C5B49_04030 [Bdellovibrio sp.]
MQNIEIKARYDDLTLARNIARKLNARFVGEDHQVDTYFKTPKGRLKLRESTLCGAELIPYLRPDQAGPKKSHYAVIKIPDPTLIKGLFSELLGVEAVVEKTREIFILDNVRIHLDVVKGLGNFFEFEAVCGTSAEAATGNTGHLKDIEKVNWLLEMFQIPQSALLEGSYRELVGAKPEYDAIAGEYAKGVEDRDDRQVVFIPTAFHYLGDIKGLRVLDLACGEGFFTRLLKAGGAVEVVGVDVSSEMIELALRKTGDAKNIKYVVNDVRQLKDYGQFDVVFAGFLLHYASSVEELDQMIRNIAISLKSGGRFITFNENPDHTLHQGIQYGVETLALEPVANGSRVKLIHYSKEGRRLFEFTRYHYERKIYEEIFTKHGLRFRWENFVLAEGLSIQDKEYWSAYTKDFSITVLTARKN